MNTTLDHEESKTILTCECCIFEPKLCLRHSLISQWNSDENTDDVEHLKSELERCQTVLHNLNQFIKNFDGVERIRIPLEDINQRFEEIKQKFTDLKHNDANS